MDIEQYIQELDKNEDKKIIINEKISKAKREQEFFVSLFPRSKIMDIGISDYVLGKSDGKDKTFSYLIEYGSTTFGKIGAASALKFVVYYSQKKQEYDYSEQFKSHTEAYDATIKLIAQCVNEAAKAIESKDWTIFDFHISQLVELPDGTPPIAVISKIIAMYFPDEFIRIWSHRWLNNALDVFQIKREHLSEGQKAVGFYRKMEQLMKFKNSHQIMKKWSNAYFSYVIGAYLKSKIEIEQKSRLLNFLKFKMKMKANYQPIVIKMLLEAPNHTISIHDIRKKFDELNFDRGNFVSSTGKAMGNDAIDSVKKALKKYAQFPEGTSDGDVILIEKNYDESYRDECLKICGQKIAKWHIDEIQRDKLQGGFTIWGTQPGSRDSNYEYLDEFLETNSIGCGWNKFGNLSKFPQKSDAWEFIRNEYPEEVNKQTATTFSHDIEKKDIIVLSKGQSEIIDFGIVTSNYEYVPKEEEESYAHRRRVVWLNRGSIKKENLPDGLMSGMVATINPMREPERIDSMIDVLLEEKIETKNYFIITSNPDSKYDDKEGKEYEFPSHIPDAKLFDNGTNFIVQTRIDDQNHFVGYGKVQKIIKKQVVNEKDKFVTMCTAIYSQYQKFDSPKLRTSEIKDKMQWIAFPNTGNGVMLPSMLAIPHSLYSEIMGEDLTSEGDETDTVIEHSRIIKILERKKNIILYGPPGTGKTFTAKEIAKQMNGVTKSVTFHQSYGYEEFIEGIRPQSTDNGITYSVKPGVFKKFCQSLPIMNWRQAAIYALNEKDVSLHYKEITKISIELGISPKDTWQFTTGYPRKTPWLSQLREMTEDIRINNENSIFKKSLDDNGKEIPGMYELNKASSKYENEIIELESLQNNDLETPKIFIIDEINRGNISKIFGELITIIENDKRGTEVTLAYSGEQFSVPSNVFIIGTMNTADQSLTHIDAALKRRFSSIEVMPDSLILEKGMKGLPELLDKINEKVREKISRNNQIGHSYFMQDGKPITDIKELQFVFATDIIPLLRDYFYDSDDDLKEVLGEEFIDWKEGSNRNVMEDWQNNPETFRIAIKKAYDVTI